MLPLLLAAAVAGQAPPPNVLMQPNCPETPPVMAVAPGASPRLKKLGDLPPAMPIYAVLREAGGCPVLQVVARTPEGGMVLRPADGGARMDLGRSGRR